jgi:hypothetical protein
MTEALSGPNKSAATSLLPSRNPELYCPRLKQPRLGLSKFLESRVIGKFDWKFPKTPLSGSSLVSGCTATRKSRLSPNESCNASESLRAWPA